MRVLKELKVALPFMGTTNLRHHLEIKLIETLSPPMYCSKIIDRFQFYVNTTIVIQHRAAPKNAIF